MRECAVPYKIAYTLFSSMHADLCVISIGKAEKLHSNFIIFQIIFIYRHKAWIVMVVAIMTMMMVMMMIEYVALIGGCLNTLYLLFLKHITHICSLFM